MLSIEKRLMHDIPDFNKAVIGTFSHLHHSSYIGEVTGGLGHLVFIFCCSAVFIVGFLCQARLLSLNRVDYCGVMFLN